MLYLCLFARIDGVLRPLVHISLQLSLLLSIFIILSGERASVLRAKLVQRCYLFAVLKNHSRPRCKPSCIVENKQVSCDSSPVLSRQPSSGARGRLRFFLLARRTRPSDSFGPEAPAVLVASSRPEIRSPMCSITPPSTPPRSVSPVEATLIDALPESPTAAVPVRSEATPERRRRRGAGGSGRICARRSRARGVAVVRAPPRSYH